MSDTALARVIPAVLQAVLADAARPVALHAPRFAGREWDYVKDCLDSGWVSSVGQYVDRFEADLAAYTGVRHAVATVNGTAALHVCLLLAGVAPGDEVLLPSLTFVATANAVAYCGAMPHFVDSDETSLGVAPTKLAAYLADIAEITGDGCRNRLTGRSIKALLVMHTFGYPVDLEPLAELCRRYQLVLIEDAAESLGSYYRGRHTGQWGRLSAVSFNGNKIATTGGGGALLTDDADLAKRAKHLTTTAKLPHAFEFMHDELAYNYRLPNLNAALGCAQLQQVPSCVAAKRRLAVRYAGAFAGLHGARFFTEPSYAQSNYWLNVLLLDASQAGLRDSVLQATHDAGFLTRPVWTPMHRLPMYQHCPRMDMTGAEDLQRRVICLPSGVGMSGASHQPVQTRSWGERSEGLRRMGSDKRWVCVVTGSRADYGLLLPVMRALQADHAFQLQVAVTGMHLAPEYGLTYRVIEADGFTIDARVDSSVSSDTAAGNSKSLGLGVIGFADVFERLMPDLVLLLGDRFEIFAAAQAALLARLPIAHIAGGDSTEGAYDEALRHGITKMAHIHFVTNADAARRVRQLGEDPAQVYNVGSPALDVLRELRLLERAELEQSLDFHFKPRNLLVTFHPETLEQPGANVRRRAIDELLTALHGLGDEYGLIFTKPNADVGGKTIAEAIDAFVTSHVHAAAYTSLGQLRYYSIMAQVDAVVGNSSSGLYEAPSLRVPTLNIGDRQKGRLRAASVIDCPARRETIATAIQSALRLDCRDAVNPYGDGHATGRIMAVLHALDDPAQLLKKQFHDWDEAR